MQPSSAHHRAVSLASAITKCGAVSQGDGLFRVTVSDLATESGMDLARAQTQLSWLTAELPGSSMEVSRNGVLVYAFPRDVQKKASRLRTTEQRELWPIGMLVKACVGLMLLASAATVRPLLVRSSDASHFSLRGELTALRAAISETRRPIMSNRSMVDELPSLSLACYGFMFGEDGGERTVAAEQLERQYTAIAAAIRANKGAVCADQLRPFLYDLPPPPTASGLEAAWLQPVEEWIMPTLARFDGSPAVTDAGDIVYVFPELLPTTARDIGFGHYPTHAPLVRGASNIVRSVRGPQGCDYLEEPYRKFLERGDARQVFAVALANWAAVLLLGALLGPWQLALRSMRCTASTAMSSFAAATLVGVNACYGALLANGFAWIIIPSARRVRLWKYNTGVRRRNKLRREEATKLTAPLQSPSLRRRLRAAQSLGQRGRRQVKAGSEAMYTTAKTLLEQAETHNPLRDVWDDKLSKESERS